MSYCVTYSVLAGLDLEARASVAVGDLDVAKSLCSVFAALFMHVSKLSAAAAKALELTLSSHVSTMAALSAVRISTF